MAIKVVFVAVFVVSVLLSKYTVNSSAEMWLDEEANARRLDTIMQQTSQDYDDGTSKRRVVKRQSSRSRTSCPFVCTSTAVVEVSIKGQKFFYFDIKMHGCCQRCCTIYNGCRYSAQPEPVCYQRLVDCECKCRDDRKK